MDHGNWRALRIVVDEKGKHKVTYGTTVIGLAGVIDTINQHHFFSLVGSDLLHYKRIIFDGVHFSVCFKTEQQFREYSFDNPNQYSAPSRKQRISGIQKDYRGNEGPFLGCQVAMLRIPGMQLL